MPSYIYVPIPSTNALQDIQTWQRGQTAKNKQASEALYNRFLSGFLKGVTALVGGGCLTIVSPGDKLYIYLHGSETPGGLVGDRRDNGSVKAYTPDGLANRLEKEGLRKDMVNISLFACGSGLGQTPFALRLKQALVRRGYNAVMVTGYLGDVRPSYVVRQVGTGYTDEPHKGIELGDGFIRRASSYTVMF